MSVAKREAKEILKLYKNNLADGMTLLERQLNALYARAQVFISLAGVVITVTGFSGRIIANTDDLAQIFIILGLSTVIFSALWVYLMVMRIRWVSSLIDVDKPEESLLDMITWRNRKTQASLWGGLILFVGLIFYGTAVALMLANPEPLSISPR